MPLINVVFLLLIFFLLAGSLRAPDPLGVQPPLADARHTRARSPGLLHEIALAADGRLALDGRGLSREELAAALADSRGELASVRLRADAAARARDLIQVLELARSGGADAVELSVEASPP